MGTIDPDFARAADELERLGFIEDPDRRRAVAKAIGYLRATDEPTIVFCMRDPDASNDYETFGEPQPYIIDIDYGYADLRDRTEFGEWREGHLEEAKQLRQQGTPNALKAAEFMEGLVAEAASNYDHDEEGR